MVESVEIKPPQTVTSFLSSESDELNVVSEQHSQKVQYGQKDQHASDFILKGASSCLCLPSQLVRAWMW